LTTSKEGMRTLDRQTIHYSMMDIISSGIIILSISLIISRLDISNLVSKKKKPWQECSRAFW
jgi:arsenate reductase-like glutaredoxin family protein